MHIGYNIAKFPANNDRVYFSNPDKKFFSKMAKEKKSNMIQGLNYLKTVGGNKRGFRKLQCKKSFVPRNIYHMVGEPTLRNLKIIIRQNIIQNLPVTVEDI